MPKGTIELLVMLDKKISSKDVRLPVHLQRAMAAEAEAAREARAKVNNTVMMAVVVVMVVVVMLVMIRYGSYCFRSRISFSLYTVRLGLKNTEHLSL